MSLKGNFKYLLAVFLLFGCESKNQTDSPLHESVRKINIGHAGSGFTYLISPFNPLPPNSFSSLKKALENGAGGVEVDLQITADHKLVLFHDVTLDDMSELTGNLAFASSDKVIGAPYKCGFPYDLFHNENIISFKKWIEHAATLSPVPFLQIDIKSGNGQTPEMLDSLLTLMIKELQEINYPKEKVIAISVDQNIISRLNHLDSTLTTAYEPSDFSSGLTWAIENKCKYLILDHKDITAENILQAREQNVGVIIFGGKSKSTITKMLNMKPDFIQSNNVKVLNELLIN